MAYCGHSRGMCGKQADCLDTLCPGRPLEYASREGGTRITDAGPVPLFCDRCTVCAGTCSTPEACELPLTEPAPSRSIPTIVWARLIGIGLGIGAFVYVIAAMNARHLFL